MLGLNKVLSAAFFDKLGHLPRFQALAAFKILNIYGHDAAIRFVRNHMKSDRQLQFIHMLDAFQAVTDEAWLGAFNAWLATKGSSEICLREGTDERFLRLAPPKNIGQSKEVRSPSPKISVIMTAFNAAATLHLAAQSILQQSWRNVELIIVNDASTDKTQTIVEQLMAEDSRVVGLVNAINVGTFASKNRGLQIAKGEYVTAHDSDDWALPQRLQQQMGHINGTIVGTLGDYIRLRPDGKISRVQPVSKITADGICQFANVSLLMKRSVALERAGYWDCLRFAADREYVDRCKILFGQDLKVTRDLTMLCLVHEKNLSVSVSKSGIWARKNLLARHTYRKSFRRWHAENKDLQLQHHLNLPFPLLQRPFAVPEKMQIGLDAQNYIQTLARTK